MFFNVFEFIYNNIIIVAIIVLSLFTAIVFGRKWYEEVRMNKRLNIKKTMLRNLKNVTFKLPSLKRTLRVFVPIVFLGLFFVLSFNVPKDYTNHLKRVDSAETFMSIYTTFNERFYSTPLQSTNVLSDFDDTSRGSRDASELIEGLDYVAKGEDRVYIASSSGIKVVGEDEETFRIEKSLLYPQMSEACETQTYDTKGIAIEKNKLVSVTYFSQTQCQESEGMLLDGPKTIVRIYDTDKDFELTDEYSIAGHLDQGHYADGDLVVASNAYLPIDPDPDMLESYFPEITHNDNRETAELSDLRYIENTNPNTFLSLTLMDIQSGEYDFETTLTDYKYLLEMDEDNVYLSTSAYQFDTSSEVFEMQNPIENIHTIISKFSLKNNEIFFSKTRKLMDMIAPIDGLTLESEGLFTLFKSEGTYYLYWFDSHVEEIDRIPLDSEENYKRLKYVNNSIFLYEENKDVPASEIKVADNRFINTDSIDYDKAFIRQLYDFQATNTSLALVSNDDGLSIDLVTASHTVIDSYELNLSEFNIATPLIIHDLKAMYPHAKEPVFYLPLMALEDDPTHLYKNVVIVLSVRDEREIIVESMIELKNITNPRMPFTYRHLAVNEETYHITPGGIFVTKEASSGEIMRKFSID